VAPVNTPTSQTTLFPVKTGTSSGTFGIQINPQNSSSPPNIVDKDGNVLATWSTTNNSFTPLDANTKVGVDNTPIGAFLNQNSDVFTKNTTTIINKLPDDQKKSFQQANTFKPYTKFAEKKDQQIAESVAATDIAGGKKEEAIGRNTAGTYGNLVYPLDIKTTAQDVIRFKILKFKPTGLNISGALSGGATLGGNRKKGDRVELGTIILPIPGNISDTNSCNWGDDKLDAFTAVGANAALTAIQDGIGKGVETLGRAVEGTAGAGNADVKTSLTAKIAELAVGGGVNILGRTQGAVFNPNLELLFSGPELRSFSFTFKMSARSKPEADEIVKIIRAFKQSMSAQTTESSIFLKAPNTYEIAYLRRQKNGKEGTEIVHTRLGKIKECALLSLTTNYAPEGQYAVYNDGTPVSYEIQMQFKELEPIFNNDYGNVTENIGF